MFISVDLPDPEAPTIETNSPRSIRSETSATPWRAARSLRVYVLLTACSSIIADHLVLHVSDHLAAFTHYSRASMSTKTVVVISGRNVRSRGGSKVSTVM